MNRLTEVHENGCICTSCLTGAAVALNAASGENIADLLTGRLENWTEHDLPTHVEVTIGGRRFNVPLSRLVVRRPPATRTRGAES